MAKAKVDISTLKQTHGALNGNQTLEEMLGMNRGYKQANIEEYRDYLEHLSDYDLHEHSVDKNITPFNNRALLIERLEKEFAASSARSVPPAIPRMSKKNQELQRKLLQNMGG